MIELSGHEILLLSRRLWLFNGRVMLGGVVWRALWSGVDVRVRCSGLHGDRGACGVLSRLLPLACAHSMMTEPLGFPTCVRVCMFVCVRACLSFFHRSALVLQFFYR